MFVEIEITKSTSIIYIQYSKYYWEANFLTSVFARLKIHKKSTKNKGFQYDVTEVDIYWSKIHETESKCKFNLYFHRYSEGVVNPLNASVALI